MQPDKCEWIKNLLVIVGLTLFLGLSIFLILNMVQTMVDFGKTEADPALMRIHSKQQRIPHLKMKGMFMRKRLVVFAPLMLALCVTGFAADDPFTGTWRVKSQLIITPTAGGYSTQENGGTPDTHIYGKDSLVGELFTINTVRIDDHTLATTRKIRFSRQDGESTTKETGKVSADVKHFTRMREVEGATAKIVAEYERVGPVPPGDAFFGTWRQTSGQPTHTIKVDGDMFDRTGIFENQPMLLLNLAIRLDGKESKTGRLKQTAQAKRLDGQTIEIVQKGGLMQGTAMLQIKGDTLVETATKASGDKIIREYERIK